MAVNKIMKATMTAAVIIFVLAVTLAGLFYFNPWDFINKNDQLNIPESTAFPETESESTGLTSEGITFKGRFKWEESDGSIRNYESDCYLRIFSNEYGTQAKFTFGEYMVDGWPVFLVSKSNDRYILESSDNSFVERVRIVADVNNSEVSGTVKNITPDISSFVKGEFTGKSIPFDQYAAEVMD